MTKTLRSIPYIGSLSYLRMLYLEMLPFARATRYESRALAGAAFVLRSHLL